MLPITFKPLNCEHVKDFLKWGIHEDPLYSMYNFEEEEENIEEWFSWKTSGKEDSYFAILLEDFALGYMGLKKIHPIFHSASLGIILDANYMGKGIGNQAVHWILDYGFCQLNLKKIDLEVLPWNERAIRLYQGLGFEKKGTKWRCLYLDPYLVKGPRLEAYKSKLVKWSGEYYVQVDTMVITRDGWGCRNEI